MDLAGVPAIVGAALPADTAMLNAGSDAFAVPLLTLIMMSEQVFSSALVGLPLSSPVAMLKFAHAGLFLIEKLRTLPLVGLAVGVNVYACPVTADVYGVPPIVGGGASMAMLKGRSDTLEVPSLTLITTP